MFIAGCILILTLVLFVLVDKFVGPWPAVGAAVVFFFVGQLVHLLIRRRLSEPSTLSARLSLVEEI